MKEHFSVKNFVTSYIISASKIKLISMKKDTNHKEKKTSVIEYNAYNKNLCTPVLD